MEVLMTRRASRTLIGVLSVTTVVGLSAYGIAHRKSTARKAEAAAAAAVAPAPASGTKGTVTLMAVDDAAAVPAAERAAPTPTTRPSTPAFARTDKPAAAPE